MGDTNGESKLGVDVQEDDEEELFVATRNQVKIVDDVPELPGALAHKSVRRAVVRSSAPAPTTPVTPTPTRWGPKTPPRRASPVTPASKSLPWYYILLAASVAALTSANRNLPPSTAP